ncbi:MAG: phosphatase PAP2 family protein [Chloroflexota bacterium]|nr:phosphatase PAP2 family protein [Chloroflexota bacterium]
MPTDVTVFGAGTLIFIDAVAAAIALALLLYRKPGSTILRWTVAAVLTLLLSFLGAQIAAALYNDPRPFVVGHYRPLIAHVADNGFPSDHSLLAAAIVAVVAFARWLWTLPFVLLGGIVEAARVGAGLHHPIDVVGSDGVVIIAALLASLLAPAIARRLMPYVPDRLLNLVAAPEKTST